MIGFAVQPPCVIEPATGISYARLGKTKSVDVPQNHHGVLIDFDEDGRVKSIMIMQDSNCRTQNGIGIGSSEAQVVRSYGHGRKVHLHMQKGSAVVGRIGDFSLLYHGIAFTFSEHKVSLIAIPETTITPGLSAANP